MTENLPPSNSPVPEPKSGSKVPLIITAVAGGVLLLGAVGTAAIAGVRSLNNDAQTAQHLTADASGIQDLDVYVAAADFEVRFDSGASSSGEATLEATTGGRSWTLERRGDSLIVDTKRPFFSWDWLASGNIDQRVVLTLPESLRDELIDADLELAAGSFRADGDFGELDLEVAAGDMRVDGSARSVNTSVSAGEAHLTLADLSELEFDVSAGDLTVTLSGAAPQLIEGSVSAGDALFVLPNEAYNVSTDISAGSVVNDLRTASDSARVVNVEVSAGKITLQPAG